MINIVQDACVKTPVELPFGTAIPGQCLESVPGSTRSTPKMSYSLKSIFASLPRTERGRPIVLGGDPKGKNFLYTSGNSVIIRDIKNPVIADIYTEHSAQTTVAKYSPSGFYIASGDVTGKVRIWDTTQKEHILKNEFQPIGGCVKDISFTGDSQRMAVVGEGREKFGHVFMMDTGTSVGEIMGHSKYINSVDFKASRPFRLVTASEDNTCVFYEGPPFKFKHTLKDHTRFVQAVRYSPDGEIFISGGSDGKAFMYSGKEGKLLGELGSPAHKGGIYALSFSPDSKRLLTVSGDKTAKVWDIATGQVVNEYTFGTTVDDMQVGCLWQNEFLLSVSLSGHINYLDPNTAGKPWRTLVGHNRPVATMCAGGGSIYTGGSDGKICAWNSQTGEGNVISGKGHTNQVQGSAVCDNNLVTCGLDDTVIFSDTGSMQYGQKVSMDSQPRGVAAASGGLAVVPCLKEVVVMRNGRTVFKLPTNYEGQSVSIHPGLTQVAVGGSDEKIHIYTLSNDTLTPGQELQQDGVVTGVAYSPDGAFLGSCNANRKVIYYELPGYERKINTEWGYHTAKILDCIWTPDSGRLATCALDTNCIVWTPGQTMKYTVLKGAHPMSHASGVAWLDNNTLVSAGHDCNLKQWTITHQ